MPDTSGPFAQKLAVQLRNIGTPLGIPVSFTITGPALFAGSGSPTLVTIQADKNGNVATTLYAAAGTGTVTADVSAPDFADVYFTGTVI